MISITLNDNGTAAELNRIASRLQRPAAMMKVVGRRGANELKAHFRRRNSTPNKLGGRRTNFWRQIADSVSSPVLETDSRIRISITDARFAQKVFGGTIRAKRAGALTIPVDPLAHGRTVAVFQQETGIQLFRPRKKGGALSNLLAGFANSDKFTVYYVLVKEIDQQKDPEALPPTEKFARAILQEAATFELRELANSSRGTP